MNSDWHDLIQRHIAGLTTDAEATHLQDSLKRDDAVARLYLRYMNLDVALEAQASSAEATQTLLMVAPPPAASRSSVWFRWRPLAAAAAGLVLGIFSASVVWAYAVPLAGRPIERKATVLAEGFEDPKMTPGRGFPTGANHWSGDLSAPVGTEPKVKPSEGSLMVRLTHPSKRKFGYAWWIVDLAEHPETATHAPLRLEVAASFNTPDPVRPSRYQIRLAAFSEEPADVRAIWNNEPLLFETVLQHVGRNVLTKPGDIGWQTVNASLQIPPGTRSVVISLAAGEADPAQGLVDHYLDDVQARFVITQAPVE